MLVLSSKKNGIEIMRISLLLLTCISLHAHNIKNEKILICGVGKNIAPALANMISKIEDLGSHFEDYHVIIYENNSIDASASLLKKWSENNPKVTIISEDLAPEELSSRTIAHAKRDKAPNRMELIAYARNKVLEKALSEDFNDYNFLLMTDMDFTHGWQVQDVLESFNITTEWDCLTANGIDSGGGYYDRYAYRSLKEPLGPELLGEEFWQDLNKTPTRFTVTSQIQKVYSAFGGVAIYKKEALEGCRYDGYITQDFEKLMSFIINNKLPKDNRQYKRYKAIIHKDQEPLPIIFQANSGYDGPVVCEHSTLHASMILKGHDKIYVNPKMICIY